MRKTKLIAATSASLIFMSSAAFAHTGHATSGLAAGLSHPLLGLDHMLAMLAVGVWAAMQPTSRAWQGPAIFISMLAVGAGLGLAGIGVPMVEPGIIASIVLFGTIIAARQFFPASAGLALIAGFALLHGHAHGTEAVSGIAGYMVGFMTASALLHLGGYTFGRIASQVRFGIPAIGLVLVAAGAALAGA